MRPSFIKRFLTTIRLTARMLMLEQERAVTNSAVIADLRAMPEYLRRDIGLVDGNHLLEGIPTDRVAQRSERWNDLFVTPHAV